MKHLRRPNAVDEQHLRYICGGCCQNPGCLKPLIQRDTNISEMAHIISYQEGGPANYDNLIVLCRECHKSHANDSNPSTVSRLREWKRQSERRNANSFAKSFSTFNELSRVAVPLLLRNREIHRSYTEKGSVNDPNRFTQWVRFTPEIIANNTQLEVLFENNRILFPEFNLTIIDTFIAHSREFVATRDEKAPIRVLLFPKDLLSIFGIEEYPDGELSPNVHALQSLCGYLIARGQFVDLQLEPEQILTYIQDEQIVKLDLRNHPRLTQIFWSGGFYRKKTTDLRLDSLIFVLRWLRTNNIEYQFPDYGNLTRLVLNNEHEIKLCYKYTLSKSDIFEMQTREQLNSGLIVVNTHNWNGAPITEDAVEYANEFDVSLMPLNKFFIYAHRNIKIE